MLEMYEFDAKVAARNYRTRSQRRSHIEGFHHEVFNMGPSPFLMFMPHMLDDPIVIDWIEQGVADGLAKFDKPEFGLAGE